MDTAFPLARRRPRGFTLVELITLVAVIAVLLGVGVPGFRQLLGGNAIRTAATDLMTRLQLARSEAIMRGRPVVLCPSPDGHWCDDTASWNRGLLAYVDREGDRARQSGDPLLHRYRPLDRRIRITTSQWRRRVVFQPSGSAAGYALTFTLCNDRGATPPRAVILSNTGRSRIARHRSDGSPLDCTLP